MSDKTGIEWTDATWNPVTGCDKISEGCRHCYAKTLHDMRHRAFLDGWTDAPAQYHVPFETVRTQPAGSSWTIALVGGRRREWGFYTKKGWMHWQAFIHNTRLTRVLWCEETPLPARENMKKLDEQAK